MGSDLKITNQLQEYILDHGLKLHPIQKEIINYNISLGDIKKMQIAISQCQFLHLIIKVSKIKKVLEIGTFTGLSTLSMALALPDNGEIIALDKNRETNKIAVNFFKKAEQNHKIKTIIKPALESLINIRNKKFDLVFIDADKENYQNYYDVGIQLIKKDGLIIIDNVLWYGEVADLKNNDKLTNIIREFNKYVNNDIRTKQIILPLGDGFTICRKL